MPGGCTPESSTALLFGVSVGLVEELGYAWLLVDTFVWTGWVKKIEVLDKRQMLANLVYQYEVKVFEG